MTDNRGGSGESGPQPAIAQAATVPHMPLTRRRPAGTAGPAFVAVTQASGFASGALFIGVVAIVMGYTNNAAWVLVPALLGMAASCLAWRYTYRRYREMTPDSAKRLLLWWRSRGLWLVLACSVPVYVAVAGAALSMNRK